MGTYLPGTGTLDWGGLMWSWGGSGVGLGLLAPETCLTNFNLPHVGEGPGGSAFATFLTVWMAVVSLIPWLSDFHSTWFLMVLIDGCSTF